MRVSTSSRLLVSLIQFHCLLRLLFRQVGNFEHRTNLDRADTRAGNAFGDVDRFVEVRCINESRIVATLIHQVGDFDAAEEAVQEAFVAAVTQWTRDGIPDSPRAWLIQTARFS